MKKRRISSRLAIKQAAKNDPRPVSVAANSSVQSSGLKLAQNSIFRPIVETRQSALVVVAGRDLSGRPVVREVVMNAARHVVQVLAEKLAGDDPRSLLARL